MSEHENNKQLNKLATFRDLSGKSLEFSMELIQMKESPIKKRPVSKDILDNSPMKYRRESDKKLSSTDINNMRFDCDRSESKKNLFRNSSSLLSVSQENKQKDLGVYEFEAHRSPNKGKFIFFKFIGYTF